MKQLLKLTVPEPCLQPWNEMSRTDTGRFCDSCNKCVVDFTHFSDQQLKDFFSKTTGKVCGNFSQYQLERFLNIQEDKKQGSFIPQLIVSAALTIGFGKSEAKEIVSAPISVQAENKLQPEQKYLPSSPTDSLNYILGRIADFENKEALPFVNVSVKGLNQEVTSDTNGTFKIHIPDSSMGKEITLLFSFVGYEKKEMQVSIHESPTIISIYLTKKDNNVRGEVRTTYYIDGVRKPSWLYRVFHRKEMHPECK